MQQERREPLRWDPDSAPDLTGVWRGIPLRPWVTIRHALALGSLLLLAACGAGEVERAEADLGENDRSPTAATKPTVPRVSLAYVGSDACASCHQDAFEAWQGSHHQLALLAPDAEQTVGEFQGETLAAAHDAVSFLRDSDAPAIEAADASGQVATFPVSYAIGVEPLQQYVVVYGDGLQQIPPVAWDMRESTPAQARWFHLYAEDPPAPGSALHWTGDLFNFESQCAECHVTGFEKRFDSTTGSYDARWEELGVGCEACHGRGSRHIAWAEGGGSDAGPYARGKGLEVALGAEHRWVMNMERGIAAREPALRRHPQTETCGQCHARRTAQGDSAGFGRPLLDTHRPALVSEDLYYPDGQILDEVYVYGSFRQSRMYEAGVECSDCHDPHSAGLLAPGDAVCATCHLTEKFASQEHTRHPGDTAGCLDCHMTERYYMVVDGRRDHSFRVPRPDLTLKTGSPNACNSCHADESPAWAAQAVATWYPGGRHNEPHYGEALAAAWQGDPRGAVEVARSTSHPTFVRASALLALQGLVRSEGDLAALDAALSHGDPLMRFSALQALEGLPDQIVIPRAAGLLGDPVRNVRMEAALLAAAADGQFPRDLQQRFDVAAAEYASAQRYNFDRDFGYLNLSNFQAARGSADGALTTLRQGLGRYPDSVALKVNLADGLRATGRDPEALALLEETRTAAPREPAVLEALALAYVREQRYQDAVSTLRVLVDEQPENPRPSVLLVLALEKTGELEEAATLLEQLRERYPEDGMVQSVNLGGGPRG